MGCCTFKTDHRVILRGLSTIGKTSIFNQLFLIDSAIPRVGHNVETFKHKRHNVTLEDISAKYSYSTEQYGLPTIRICSLN
ncbi:P-loop_containing nucleoside triphosphate hydrolase [Hexamita inflata]|uniref:P-loop containing nucleoside triphosphate hydrolase n=1 Tax=Hexamita inflata TaxID=28002 RepID=A0AA86UCB5_9EUKA|nr:P-loop containing nucleoside triphosphate hydrolase [Hexamita inflata]